MKVSGILFSRPMVLALKLGTKTQTRRVVNPQPIVHGLGMCTVELPGRRTHLGPESYLLGRILPLYGCPYGAVGDHVYCKETCISAAKAWPKPALYAADYEGDELAALGKLYGGWKPSIMMREDEARFRYRLAALRVERLQAITEEDAKAEGIEPAVDGSYVSAYAALWNQINSGFKPVKTLADKRWKLTHYVSHPWGGENATVTHKGLPAYVRPNPFVFALTLAPLASQDPTATPTAQEA